MNDNRPRRRARARYAPDAEVKRALRLAREEGLNPAGLTLGPDGSVTVLDSAASAPAHAGLEGTADEALAAWEAQHGHPRHA
ncbi:MAG TPA: hypothetical protein PLS69_05930 [Terricaulis sp.]|nr:hypothetical protein [Terricaulis sp.]